MSYDISLTDPVTGETLRLDATHHMRGGTYAVGGTTEGNAKRALTQLLALAKMRPDGVWNGD